MDPAAKRSRVKSYVTPLGTDVLFYELVDGELPRNQTWTYGTAHPDTNKWPNHELIYVSPDSEDGRWQRRYYAAKRSSQNDYNFIHNPVTGASTGWDMAFRDYIVKRSEWTAGTWKTNYSAPAAVSGYTDIGETDLGYEVTRAPQEFDSLYVIVRCQYVRLGSVNAYRDRVINDETGEIETFTRTLEETSSYSGVASDGTYEESRQLNHRLYLNTTGTVKPFDERSWTTTESFYWPPVLQRIPSLQVIYNADGRAVDSVVDWDLKEAYNGPCRVDITEEWTKTLPDVTIPTIPKPSAITHSGPFIKFSIPPCLHIGIAVYEIVGNNHPNFQAGDYSRVYNATNVTDWPESITFETVRPYRSGYIKTSKTYYSPDA